MKGELRRLIDSSLARDTTLGCVYNYTVRLRNFAYLYVYTANVGVWFDIYIINLEGFQNLYIFIGIWNWTDFAHENSFCIYLRISMSF